MKFRSTTGQDVHIALTTGQTALITTDGVELDKIFHKEAIARGCLRRHQTGRPAADNGYFFRGAESGHADSGDNGRPV